MATLWQQLPELPGHNIRKLLELPLPKLAQQTVLFAGMEPAVQQTGTDTELARVLLHLLEKTLRERDLPSSITLYQLLISGYRWHFRGASAAVLDHPLAYPYLLWLLQNNPRHSPRKVHLPHATPNRACATLDTVRLFAWHDAFSGWGCDLVAARFDADKDVLMDLARVHPS